MALPGYSKQALTDLPTANVNAGTNYFVVNEQRWYYYNGTEWVKHSDNYPLNLQTSLTTLNTEFNGFKNYMESSLITNNVSHQSLANQISVVSENSNYERGILSDRVTVLENNNNNGGTTSNTPDYTELLLKFNGPNNSTDFIDDSKNDYLIIPSGNPIISTNESKFFGSSLYLNGSSALSLPSINFKSNWTIETWFKTLNAGYRCIICQDAGGGNEWALLIDPDGSTSYYNIAYPNGNPLFNDNIIINDNLWHHIAISRDKSSIYFYLDGVLIGNKNNLTNFDYSTATPIRIGFMPSYGRYFNGYLNYLRISSKAIYTPYLYPNGFTVPDYNFNVTAFGGGEGGSR